MLLFIVVYMMIIVILMLCYLKKRKIDFIDLFINVVVILFLEYEYKCIEFEDLLE